MNFMKICTKILVRLLLTLILVGVILLFAACESNELIDSMIIDSDNICKIVTIPQSEPLGPFQPYQIPNGGDCDFGGEGCLVIVTAKLELSELRDRLMATFTLQIEENQEDWTAARGSWQVELYRAPVGWEISRILGNSNYSGYYFDYTDQYPDKLISDLCTFIVWGNTCGNDICDDREDDCSRMLVILNPIMIEIRCPED